MRQLQPVALLTRQLATMVDAHVPLVRALDCYAGSDMDEPLRRVVSQVATSVSSGQSLSRSLALHPEWFTSAYVALIASAEGSGRLAATLTLLATMLERQLRLSKKMVAALTYPATLLVVSLLCTAVFVFWVFPQLLPMFEGAPLPWPTLLLIAGTHAFGPVLALAVGCAALARLLLPGFLGRHEELNVSLSRWPLQLPGCGPLLQQLAVARVLYVLSALLEAGQALVPSLKRSAAASGNPWICEQLLDAVRLIEEGETVASALEGSEVFPGAVLQLLRAGEESSGLAAVADRVALWCDAEAESALEHLTTLLEPVLMVSMGLGVGFVLVSAMLPTINLINSL